MVERVFPLAFCALILASTLNVASNVQAEESGAGARPTITVTGDGRVEASPDLAIVTAGVNTQATTVDAALAENTQIIEALIAALTEAQIDDRDVQTTDFRVQPNFAPYDPAQPNRPQRIIGYSVSNSLDVKLRQLSKLGLLLDQFVKLGANQIGTLRFSVADPAPLEAEARREAVIDAERRAKTYAEAANLKLGRLVSIREAGGLFGPEPMAEMRLMAQVAAVPIAEGAVGYSASVTIVYELLAETK